MEPDKFIDPNLTDPDRRVLRILLSESDKSKEHINIHEEAKQLRERLESINDPRHVDFEPTITVTWDTPDLQAKLPRIVARWLLQPYVQVARRIVRVETDVVMLSHLILYFTTVVPSAAYLYYNFTWLHGILHWLLQSYYVGTYTLMMHQHIHMGGILSKNFWLVDTVFPYITNPLMGHTWNSYFYHHVKHHHVEGNGPSDLSTTIRYQRDDLGHFLCYLGRFFFFIWIELPVYFMRKGQIQLGIRAGLWEVANYGCLYVLYRWVNARATAFAFILPLVLLRIGLMVGNWGQHALVDEVNPNSDYRSSITLIDVASNRFCFNDGYHTSHHLNPRRHWREHPLAFFKQRLQYASEGALVFRNIDYIMITYRLLRKDYMHLAKCLVPLGDQAFLTMEERAAMLRRKTRKFSEAEINEIFGKGQ